MAIKVEAIKPAHVHFGIAGTSPLIQHAWSDKALKMLRMTAQERRKQPKVARDPEAEGEAAMHRLEDGSPALPLLAFKAAMIGAAHKDLGIEKTLVRKSFFLPHQEGAAVPMAKLTFDDYSIREDLVRVGAGQTDLRYRPQFNGWRVEIDAIIDPAALSLQDILNLVNRAGFSVGVGEWRPEKGGEYGRFEVDSTVSVTQEGV